MAVRATRLDGWKDHTPKVKGNDGEDPVTVQIRPLTAALEVQTVFKRGEVPPDVQRDILMSCARNLRNYFGVDGEEITVPMMLLTDAAGKEAAKYVLEIVTTILGMSWSKSDLGESGAQSASS